jgi:hypothetical protein
MVRPSTLGMDGTAVEDGRKDGKLRMDGGRHQSARGTGCGDVGICIDYNYKSFSCHSLCHCAICGGFGMVLCSGMY